MPRAPRAYIGALRSTGLGRDPLARLPGERLAAHNNAPTQRQRRNKFTTDPPLPVAAPATDARSALPRSWPVARLPVRAATIVRKPGGYAVLTPRKLNRQEAGLLD